jgi:hypothetical protein
MDFVKEGKLEEEKKRRQAEWERVRNKETDPIGNCLHKPSEGIYMLNVNHAYCLNNTIYEIRNFTNKTLNFLIRLFLF